MVFKGVAIVKKVISLFLSITIIGLTVFSGVQKPLVAKAEETQISSFINNTVTMIRENDVGKDFVVESESETSTFSTDSTYTENYDFQTCRLIVKADKDIEKLNSIGVSSGFLDFYIVQFQNESDAKTAYEYYSECDYITSVSPDRVFSISSDYVVDDGKYITYENGTPERLGFWGSEITGAYEVKDYIESEYNISELPEIKVAVIDTGVDLNHEFIKDRLIETGFNSSSGGVNGSEYDITEGHGTGVTGTIIDNTPSNVKVANYKISDGKGNTTSTSVVIAILQAVEDNCHIINMSFGLSYLSDTEYNSISSAISKAYNKGCVLVASAGNDNLDNEFLRKVPTTIDNVITVAASNQYNMPTSFSNRGKSVNLMAPGENVPILLPENKYKLSKGTSYSAPFIAAVVALLTIIYPTENNIQLERRLESTADKCDLAASEEMYGYGIIDVIGAAGLSRLQKPVINLEEGTYIGEIEIKMFAPDGYEIYYTTDQSYPTKENGTLYTEPLILEDDNFIIHAVSFKENYYRSDYISKFYRISSLGTNDMFEIDSKGTITAYVGTVKDLTIPDEIDGVKVTSLAEGLFSEATLYGVTFPETIEILPKNLFYQNSTIQFVDGPGVTEILDSAFYICKKLYSVNFPQVQTIGEKAFYYSTGLSYIDFPQCTYIGKNAFQHSLIRYAHLPSAEIICYQAFYQCSCLYDVYVPNLVELRRESYWGGAWQGGGYAFKEASLCVPINIEKAEIISHGAFYQTNVTRLEFSNAKIIESLPITYCKEPLYGTIIAVLPATLESCGLDRIPYYDEGVPYEISYMIYGTSGTYAEEWAKENGFKFVSISADNPTDAIITDLPDEYYSYMHSLEADVVGFNRIYKWYGSNTPNYYSGILIQEGKNKNFDPDKYKQYKYYYCVVESTDVGHETIEIRTGICENKSYVVYSPEKINGIVEISTPSTRYIKFGESVNLYATSAGLPDGTKIKWRIVEGSAVTLDASVSGTICTVTSKSNGFVTIEAYAVNKNGNTIVNENGNRICDREGISSEVNLWLIIIYYIKKIFSLSNTVINLL